MNPDAQDNRTKTQLRQAQKMEALGMLAVGMAHDFNTILGIIIGYADMAYGETAEESRMRRQLQQVLTAASRAKDLVRQVLAYGRCGEDGHFPVEVGLIAKEVVKMLQASRSNAIEIRTEVMSKAQVTADPSQIHQLLLNLCSNALDAMREKGGTLTVSLTDVDVVPKNTPPNSNLRPGPHLHLTVTDTGRGVDPALLDRIFDPFFTTCGAGTGLGLCVVHGIVTGLKGAIEVSSAPGLGTTFQVWLPARQTTVAEKRPRTAAPSADREPILFVKDKLRLPLAAKPMLERRGG